MSGAETEDQTLYECHNCGEHVDEEEMWEEEGCPECGGPRLTGGRLR